MCEALNGTFKRDYVYENCLDTPESVYAQIAGWVKTYNSYAPHSALGMKTPEDFFYIKNRCLTGLAFKWKEEAERRN